MTPPPGADDTGPIRQISDFPSAPDGVGALPLRPEATGREALEAWVGRVIE